jgi:hypothetical protein
MMAVAGLCAAANADIIGFNGQEYHTVDWTSVSSDSNTASGQAGGVGVSFETMNITSDLVTTNDYNGASGFTNLSYGSGVFGSINMMAGMVGTSSLSFDGQVSSVLIIIRAPNDSTPQNLLGAAVWDFSDDYTMSLADSTEANGLVLETGNMFMNGLGNTSQIGGVIAIDGIMDGFSWDQSTFAGLDQTQVTFAVSTTVPAPATGLALVLPAAFAARRRR